MKFRKPAAAPPPVVPASAMAQDPTPFVEARYRQIFDLAMRDLPFINPALRVQGTGFQQYRGDWLGALVTPWWAGLVLICGGGELWQDIPSGERRLVAIPAGPLPFIADVNEGTPILPILQYSPLFAPPSQFSEQESAIAAVQDALAAALQPPPALTPEEAEAQPAAPSRRAFFRRIAGK